MLSIRVLGVSVEISLLFTAFFCLVCAVSPFALSALVFMLFHECGHLIAMLCVRCKPKLISLAVGRMTIVPREEIESRSDEAAVLLAGAAANLVLSAVCCASGAPAAAKTNIFMAVFNLLPVTGTDGGRIAELYVNSAPVRMIISLAVGLLFCAAGLFGLQPAGIGANPVLAAAGILIVLNSVRHGRDKTI